MFSEIVLPMLYQLKKKPAYTHCICGLPYYVYEPFGVICLHLKNYKMFYHSAHNCGMVITIPQCFSIHYSRYPLLDKTITQLHFYYFITLSAFFITYCNEI